MVGGNDCIAISAGTASFTLPHINQYVQSVALGGGRISYCRSDVANGDILGCEINQEGFFSKPQMKIFLSIHTFIQAFSHLTAKKKKKKKLYIYKIYKLYIIYIYI